MNIPEEVRIGSVDYKIILTKEPILLNHQEARGLIDFNMSTITLNEEMLGKQGLERTLLHEIVHGIIFEKQLEMDDEKEEEIADMLAFGIHQLIRDNPTMFMKEQNV